MIVRQGQRCVEPGRLGVPSAPATTAFQSKFFQFDVRQGQIDASQSRLIELDFDGGSRPIKAWVVQLELRKKA